MVSELRKTGITVVGDRAWGAHLCLFYETKEDLLEKVVPYLKAGFEGGEYCVWVIPDILTQEEAYKVLRETLSGLGQSSGERRFEIPSGRDLYLTEAKVLERYSVLAARPFHRLIVLGADQYPNIENLHVDEEREAMSFADPQGRVALMLCESILHVMVEERVITKEKALEAINTVAELTREIAEGNPTVAPQIAADLVRAIAESFALKD